MTAQINYIKKLQKGFTLIELLVVIGILAILLAITLIAINPARQFSLANNTQRSSDVNAILGAVGQYAAENNGTLPANLPTTCTSAAPCTITNDTAIASRADICSVLVTDYMAALPGDPSDPDSSGAPFDCSGTYNTEYQVYRAGDNRITVLAPGTELQPNTPVIAATR